MKMTRDCSSFLVGSWISETNQQNIVGLNAKDKVLQQRILKFHLLELLTLHFAFAGLIITTRLKVSTLGCKMFGPGQKVLSHLA